MASDLIERLETWQPIETAPKDGTRILTFAFLAVDYGYEQIQLNWWSERLRTWAKTNVSLWPATHWQHLPAPPCLAAIGSQEETCNG